MESVERSASGPRCPLVASVAALRACTWLAKVRASRALQQVSARRGHIAQLWRRSRQQCLRKNRIAFFYICVPGKVGVAHQSADPKSAVRQLFDLVQWQQVNIDQRARLLNAQLHQVDKRRTTCNKLACTCAG
jgi:hypothetical protein